MNKLATVLALFLVAVPATWAATFNVTKTADTADGSCDADCSLREAVVAANALGGSWRFDSEELVEWFRAQRPETPTRGKRKRQGGTA